MTMPGRDELSDELQASLEDAPAAGEEVGDARPFPAELEPEYEVVRELGRGGMAVVYLARDRELRRDVAIKVVQAQYVTNAEVLARFAREARTVAALDHPNIVTLYAVRKLADSSLALIMQYVPGETLQQLLDREGAFSFGRARQALADVAHALGYAHARGIVHRDVKPENVFVDARTGRAMLSDFGIARSSELDPRVTRTNVAIGTPAYMSPEQIDGAVIDGRSDLYSLGLVGWELVTGRQPWQGEGLYGVIYRQKHDELPPVDEVRRETPPELVAAIEGALEKDPHVRWAHADDFLDVLTGRVVVPPRRRRQTPMASVPHDGALRPDLANSPTVQWRRDGGDAIPGLPPAPLDANAATGAAPNAPRRPAFLPTPMPGRPQRPVRAPSHRGVAAAGILAAAAIALGVSVRQRGVDLAPRPAPVVHDSPATISVAVRPESAAGSIVVPAVESPAVAAATTGSGASGGESLAEPSPAPTLPPVSAPARVPVPAAQAPGRDSEREQRDVSSAASPALPPRATPSPPAVTARGADPRPPGTSVSAPAESGVSAPAPALGAPARGAAAEAAGSGDAVLVSSSVAVATLAPGGSHTCEIAADGTALCWGANAGGQLGDGTTERRTVPTATTTEQRFVSISAGLGHTCAVSAGGSAYCWGSNDRGQLGDGTRAARTSPVRVSLGAPVRTVESANLHSCALTVGGEVHCWGANPYGELGVSGGPLARPTPVRVPNDERFTLVALGWNHTCALTASRHALCWGQDSDGRLGDGDPTEARGPVAVSGNLEFVSLAAGSAHTCAVAAGGVAYCWGRNNFGQLGDGTSVERPTPTRVSGGARFVRVTAGSVHSCGLTARGEAYCWGRNAYGQLGDGTGVSRATPVRVQSRERFVALRASGSHTCGTTASRRNVCWGYNLEGQLGDGTRIHRARPVAVTNGS